jgi:hypothetical protein
VELGSADVSQPTDADLATAFADLARFGVGPELTRRIAHLESVVPGRGIDDVVAVLAAESVTGSTLAAAKTVKAAVGQINVVLHAVGILVSLPHLLAPGETVEALSLGAGNTGRDHDLVTSEQIAEFKFIDWRGGAEAVRQNTLFVDLFNLATATTATPKRRVMYVVGREHPMRFLHNRRAIASVLSKHRSVADRFEGLYGEQFKTVRDYYETIESTVEIVDLKERVPLFAES